jgi:hypothetical protein
VDLESILRDLRSQRDTLAAAIAKLESLSTPEGLIAPFTRSRRGRKSMGAEERREVSARIKRYWAKRRKA